MYSFSDLSVHDNSFHNEENASTKAQDPQEETGQNPKSNPDDVVIVVEKSPNKKEDEDNQRNNSQGAEQSLVMV